MQKKTIYVDGIETNYSVFSNGDVFNEKTKRFLKGTTKRNEYKTVQLIINRKPKSLMVHRLVAEAFCENPNNYTIVDHIDRNKLNNNYLNLRWVTQKDNRNNREQQKNIIPKSCKVLSTDEYKDIVNYPDYGINEQGVVINKITKRILCGTKRNGYIRITFSDNKKYSLHRLIWEAFNGEIPDGYVIDHIDGNRANNTLSNLRLVSQSDNMLNAQRLGHSGQSPISQYDKNGNFIKKYSSIVEAAKAIGGSQYAIKEAADRYGTSAGYFWIKDNQNITIDEILKITKSNKPKSSCIGVTQLDMDNNIIAHYESMGAAQKATGINATTIRRAADAKRLGKGFYWILDNK